MKPNTISGNWPPELKEAPAQTRTDAQGSLHMYIMFARKKTMTAQPQYTPNSELYQLLAESMLKNLLPERKTSQLFEQRNIGAGQLTLPKGIHVRHHALCQLQQ